MKSAHAGQVTHLCVCVCVCVSCQNWSRKQQRPSVLRQVFQTSSSHQQGASPGCSSASAACTLLSSRLRCALPKPPPFFSASRKCPSCIQLQRGASRAPPAPDFLPTDGLLFMAEPSSPPPSEERQPHTAAHGGQGRRVKPVSGCVWRPPSLPSHISSCAPQSSGAKQHPVHERPLPLARLRRHLRGFPQLPQVRPEPTAERRRRQMEG